MYEGFEDEFGFEEVFGEIGRKETRVINLEDLTGTTFDLIQVDTLDLRECNLELKKNYYHVNVEKKRGEKRGVRRSTTERRTKESDPDGSCPYPFYRKASGPLRSELP